MDATSKMTGEEIVISGISGVFPKSDNVIEFMDNLYNKVDMVSSYDWEVDHPEIPKYTGIISGMHKFDAQFFRVPKNQAVSMDSMSRKLLEQAYCAVFDAGINPVEFKGCKIGVYTGSSYQDYSSTAPFEKSNAFKNSFIVAGGNRSMFSNRISYWCDGKGPSYTIDNSDISFTEALEKAYNDVKAGVCEAAIVSGCSVCLLPNLYVNLGRTGVLCLDGKTKCFAKNGDGYVRSGAVGVLFLQKAKDAKRIYAEVCHVKTNYGTHADNNLRPQRKSTEIVNFLKEFYSEVNVSPSEVEYIEGHGIGLVVADDNELTAVGDVFGKQKPVMVGCVKSNMGNSEPASGVCAVTKVLLCLAYHKGILPTNLHCDEPIENSKIKILTDHATFKRGYTAVNNFSTNGGNGHILMKGYFKPKIFDRYKSSIPRLVCISGRQHEGVEKIFDIMKNQNLDTEVIALLHNIYKFDIPGHTCRGYTILDTDEEGKTVSLTQDVEWFQRKRQPIWFVYSGMGSQWATMGAELMKIPIFAAAIEKCHKALEPKGLDLIRVLTDPDKKVFDNILNCFVGITAVQIGLTDVLRAIDIVPDFMIGHSMGEIGCAYCDGAHTAEETILCSYTRGIISLESELIKGSMAAVGLGFNQLEPLCPPEIDIACHNSSESCTISGPVGILKEFVKELAAKDIFVKEVPCANIAYHSRYVKNAALAFQKGLEKVIKAPVKRSQKWICSSLPEQRWTEPLALCSSAEYHTNNFMSPVYFEESAGKIPKDAIIVEIAPHSILQAILKRSHPDCTHIPLTRRGNSNPIKHLLEAFGKFYQKGLNPKIYTLYPKIDFPVSTETLPISQLVEWYHEENWPVLMVTDHRKIFKSCREIPISLEDSEYKFIVGNVKNGNILFPETLILVTIWELLAMYNGRNYEDMSVAFRDVKFLGELVLDVKQICKLSFDINKGNGYFEVSTGATIIAVGYISELAPQSIKAEKVYRFDEVNSEDIYSSLQTKGYFYAGDFQSIASTNAQMDSARVKWNKNWTTLLDSLLQINLLRKNYNGVSVPKLITYLDINTSYDPDTQRLTWETNEPYLNAFYDQTCGITKCAGIEIRGLIFEDKPRRNKYSQVLQHCSFTPYISDMSMTIEDAILLNLQIVAENIQEYYIAVAVLDIGTQFNIASIIDRISDNVPDNKFDIKLVSTGNSTQKIKNSHLVVVPYNRQNGLNLPEILSNNEFVLSLDNSEEDLQNNNFNVLFTRKVNSTILALLKKKVKEENTNITPIIYNDKFTWISQVRSILTNPGKVVLVSEKKFHCNIAGVLKLLKKEFGNKICFVSVDDPSSPKFNYEDTLYKNQIEKNVFVNILKDGQWGSFYHLPCLKTPLVPENFSLVCDNLGQLDSLNWVETPNERKLGTLVQVCFAGLSVRDVKKATGLLGTDNDRFGMDFSGINGNGQKVMGVVASGALASAVEPDLQLIWPVPHHWTLEEAATVPLPYIHAYYCLLIKTNVRPWGFTSRKVFVTSGAGAFGQAVISICLSLGWTVFTSVGDISKKHYLLQRFPQLNEKHVVFSYDAAFFNMIAMHTKGEMCHLVLNTYTGMLREFAVKCVRHGSYFMDLSNYDMRQNEQFGMQYLTNDRSYSASNLSSIFDSEFVNEKKLLQMLLADGIAKGVVKPISHVVFNNDEVTRAFRLLSSRKRKGRFLIKIEDASAPSKNLKLMPRISCSSKGIFVIICDNSNSGVELANRLVKRGARNLVLHCEGEKKLSNLHAMSSTWHPLGVKVYVNFHDLEQESNCLKLLKFTNDKKVHGIFYIKPQAKECNDEFDLLKTENETTKIPFNLDAASRTYCPDLKFFVIIARTSNGIADEYSTSALENIAKTRFESGLPALMFRTAIENEVASNIRLIELQTLDTVLNSLEFSLRQNLVSVCSHNVHSSKYRFWNILTQIVDLDKDIDENFKVCDLTTSTAVIEELKVLLKDTTNNEYSSDKIKDLTIARLKTLSAVISKSNTKFDSGLNAFYNYVDKDEMETTNILIPMSTLVDKIVESEYQMDSNETHLMLIPGFEGHPKVFDPISERLKVRAATCQMGPDMTSKSIPDIALVIKQFICKRLRMKSRFHILGYSFGVNIALEIAALLEKDGLVGQVFCLDSSPDALKEQMDAYIGTLSEEELQNAIVRHIFYIMSGQRCDALGKEVKRTTTWSEKVELCIKHLRRYVSYSADYQRVLLDSAYKRLILARDYIPNIKLESEIVLIKGIPHPKARTLPKDYNLSKLTKKPVRVFDISSDFVSAPEDCKVSNIINQLLDAELIESFKTNNVCEAYYL